MGKSLPGKRMPRPTAILNLTVSPLLKEFVGQLADAADLPMNEWFAQFMADQFDRPELAKIPRNKVGRPRNSVSPDGNGHTRSA